MTFTNNSLTGFNLNWTEYLYVKNAQGDIAEILDKDGKQVVSYTYDAWGKVESISGSSADTVGKLNPMRYRGYYEDTEVGLYYLQSRYYNPKVCRFISTDEPLVINNTILDTTDANLYAYCNNNSINMIDMNGNKSTYIDSQSDYTKIYFDFKYRYMKNIPWGFYGNIADNGCGVIAAYNVLVSKNSKVLFYDVYLTLRDLGGPILQGLLGTNPATIKYLMGLCFNKVYSCTFYKKQKWIDIAGKSEAVIVLYKTRKLGMHYIAGIKVNRDEFRFYNADTLDFKVAKVTIYDLIKEINRGGRIPLLIIGVAKKKSWW